MVKIAAAQLPASEDMDENFRAALRYIERAAREGAELVCFPEGHLSRYAPQYQGLAAGAFAIPPEHPYMEGFRRACRENRIAACVSPCLELEGKVYSAAVLISSGGEILCTGTKNHIVRAEHFYEQDYFTPGRGGFAVTDTPAGRAGIVMCFDRHYPDSFLACAQKGAGLAIVPVANEKAEPAEMYLWEMRVAAFQHSLYIAVCNRAGTEGAMDFSGGSAVIGPDGELLALAGDGEELLTADIDPARAGRIREKRQYLPLRRPEVFR